MKSSQRESDEDDCRRAATRYAKITVDPGANGFYPESLEFLEQAEVTHERVHHVAAHDDGTIVGLYELHGDADRISAGIETLPHVLSYDVTDSDPVFLYLHERAIEPAKTIVETLRDSTVAVDFPFEHRLDGSIRVTVIGVDEAIRRTFDALDEVLDVHLEETGDFHSDLGTLSTLLTERQRQILELAIERGYYEVPRGTTHQDIANVCGLSQATVAEHLQKTEARVIPNVVARFGTLGQRR